MKRAKKQFLIYIVLPLVTAALLGGMLGSVLTYEFKNSAQSNPNSAGTSQNKKQLSNLIVLPEESAVTTAVKKSSPAVVSIIEGKFLPGSINNSLQGVGVIGSGFIVSPDGTIITNAHVVSDPNAQYYVLTENSKIYQIQYAYRDTKNDIAIVQIYSSNLPFIKFGDSGTIKSGQKVIAIGTALGKFNNTVSIGNISAIGRNITASNPYGNGQENLTNIIQTDIAINPGNSGGPLLDLNGEAVGVNVAYTAGASNIGFAIPSNTVKKIVESFNQDPKNQNIKP